MDASAVLGISKWVVAELVRLFHASDVTSATATVNALIERKLASIWEVDGRKRVLANDMPRRDQVLLLLCSSPSRSRRRRSPTGSNRLGSPTSLEMSFVLFTRRAWWSSTRRAAKCPCRRRVLTGSSGSSLGAWLSSEYD